MNEAPMSSEELAAILQREYTAADSYRDVLAQLELQHQQTMWDRARGMFSPD